MSMRNKLTNWKKTLPLLASPKMRPNDFQRLVIACLNNDMTVRDATRVFSITEKTALTWHRRFAEVKTENDKSYFMRRARELGADDETIAQWFGFDRPDKVSMLLAEK